MTEDHAVRGDYGNYPSICIRVATPKFTTRQPTERSFCFRTILEGLQSYLSVRTHAAPVADQRNPAEQGRLNRQHIEPPHVTCGIDTAKVERLWFRVRHEQIFAFFGIASN